MYHPFSVAETTKTAWTIYKKNFVTIIVYSVISVLLLSLLKFAVEYLSPRNFTYEMITSFALVFAQAYTTLGLYKLIFTVIDSEYYEFELRQVLPPFKSILSYLGVISFIVLFIFGFSKLMTKLDDYPNLQGLIQQIAVLIALYFALRIMFFVTYIVDDQSGGFESLKQSYKLTKGYFFKVLIMLLIILLFIALPAALSQYPGLGFLWIGIMFTYPFVNIILAVTYRKLVYSHQDVDDDIAETN
jgi:membrane-anchored glycerophosphoryl diester phosphodiesterase (GDPDase)